MTMHSWKLLTNMAHCPLQCLKYFCKTIRDRSYLLDFFFFFFRDASSSKFDYYKSGVYATSIGSCSARNIDHVVLLTGYGTDSKGNKIWIIKNQWGRTNIAKNKAIFDSYFTIINQRCFLGTKRLHVDI